MQTLLSNPQVLQTAMNIYTQSQQQVASSRQQHIDATIRNLFGEADDAEEEEFDDPNAIVDPINLRGQTLVQANHIGRSSQTGNFIAAEHWKSRRESIRSYVQ